MYFTLRAASRIGAKLELYRPICYVGLTVCGANHDDLQYQSVQRIGHANMLTILGKRYRLCDGVSRRSFLKIGGLALGGASLPKLLQAESQGGARRSHKAIIMIFLPGGPPHQDMFDLKLDAPSEIRGEFKPIKTNVPGIDICEHFPRLAAMTDKVAILRSIVGATGGHDSFQCLSGRSNRNGPPPGGWPALGAVLSKVNGPVNPALPPFVGLAPPMGHKPWSDPGRHGFLGLSHAPFKPNGQGKEDLVLKGITLERLGDRKRLLAGFDQFRREADSSGLMEGLDAFNKQAFGVLTSSRLAAALDYTREDPKIIESYGKGDPKPMSDGGPRMMEHFLIARRLVEAGARCVTVAFSRWDWHGGNFTRGRQDMPMLDQGVTALINDLHQRGLDQDVSVVVWGEFGRTPQINKGAGRDHWPRVSCGLLACGGMRTGQVIGATDRLGGEASERPVHFQDVFASLYHNLGIDVTKATVDDLSGRPRYLVDNNRYQRIEELS